MKPNSRDPSKISGRLLRDLEACYINSGDDRFAYAIEALKELFPPTGAGREREWDDFRLVMLWIQVNARLKAKPGTKIDAACEDIALRGGWLPGRSTSGSSIERRYHQEAVPFFERNPEEAAEAEQGAVALACVFQGQKLRLRKTNR
jgi:hypothetical protein